MSSYDVFNVDDLAALLPSIDDSGAPNVELIRDFMSTFTRIEGCPVPPAGSDRALPLRARVIMSSSNVPANSPPLLQSMANVQTRVFEKSLKIPVGAVRRMQRDEFFATRVACNITSMHTDAVLVDVKPRCFHCGKKAVGFRGQTRIRGLNAPGGTIEVFYGPCLPNCIRDACCVTLKQRLTDMQSRSDWGRFDGEIGRKCAYPQCSKMEDPEGEKHMFCSRCKVVFYCSKECQANHWKKHKRGCKPFQS